MKKIKNFLAIVALILVPILSIADDPTPQPPPPPGPGGGPGGGGTPVGAPIDGGLGILLALGLGYGGMKLYQTKKDNNDKELKEE